MSAPAASSARPSPTSTIAPRHPLHRFPAETFERRYVDRDNAEPLRLIALARQLGGAARMRQALAGYIPFDPQAANLTFGMPGERPRRR